MDWFVAKGMLESVLNQIGLLVEYQPDRRDSRLHPGRTASLWWQGERLGIFGQLHPQLRQERGLPDAIYVFELDLEVVMDAMGDEANLVPKFIPFSTFPALERDIAFFATVDVTVGDLKRLIVKLGDSLLEGVELFDQYHGESVPNGQRSLAFRLTYRSGDRTLTDGEVDPIHQAIREGLKEHFQVSLRS
jgi:phenylalanyl-tRNA synthetase beta chain